MQYLLSIHGDEQATASVSKDELGQMYAAYNDYTKAMKEAGVYLGGNPLMPSKTGSRVQIKGGKRSVLDGPFTETKEVLGGYYLIEVKSKEEAIEWGARCPGAKVGFIELRPIASM